jgi:hypothetical protein
VNEKEPYDYETAEGSEIFLVDVCFDETTHLHPPEQSYLSELLDRPIPLHHRIAHLIPYVDFSDSRKPMSEIVREIDVDLDWAKRAAARIGIEAHTSVVNHEERAVYPGFTAALLEEEWAWKQAYDKLQDQVSLTKVAEFVARRNDWVKRITNELGEFPDFVNVHGRAFGYFNKKIILDLRHIILSFMPAEEWMTTTAMAKFLGRKVEWVQHNLSKGQFESEERWGIDGRLRDHYSPEALNYLLDLKNETVPRAGNKLTITAIAARLDRTFEWVELRIKAYFPNEGTDMLDDRGRPSLHYGEEVVRALETLSQEDEALPYATPEHVALSGLARVLGHTQRWIEHRLPYTDISPIRLRNPVNNVPGQYYLLEDSAAKLRALPENILDIRKKQN